MILDIYKDLFERIYIFSPSVNIDDTWKPVKAYLHEKIKLKEDEPPLFHDAYDPIQLSTIIDNQKNHRVF
jgi:hypothetical protein